jgi:hypothetical protein
MGSRVGRPTKGGEVSEEKLPRTRLEQLLRQRHLTLEEFRKLYNRIADVDVSDRQAYRWMSGQVRGLPHPAAAMRRHQGGAARGRTGKGRSSP